MTDSERRPPRVGVMIGDPNGIGPEIVAKVWADRRIHACCRPLAIGSAAVLDDAIRITGVPLRTRIVDEKGDDAGQDGVIDVIESTPFAVDAIRRGHDAENAGAVSGAWLDHADRLARAGLLDATVMGPISAKAMSMAGTLHTIASHKPGEEAYLLLRSGRLVIAHLTDHVALREVSGLITQDSVYRLIRTLAAAMRSWGLPGTRIGVAGFNPHASGDEEKLAIVPAIARAQGEGIEIEGPVSPDSIFRHCIEGSYDAVIAMYHDQGHIAIKTWGFSGNNVVFLGPSYVHTTVAHGVAYDLAGSGRADSSMIENAILNAGWLASGKGFCPA